QRFVLWKNPRRLDNVCIAARDIDGDGKVEIAVGAEWNPGDTRESGSVHWLVRPEKATDPWGVVDLHREPTVHRMRWVEAPRGVFQLVVAPLHGRGNVRGQGEGVRTLAYAPPKDPKVAGDWKLELVDGGMHVSHNIDPVEWDDDPEEEILIAGTEGIFLCDRGAARWTTQQIAGNAPGETENPGAGEVRLGRLGDSASRRFIATIEPFHGNSLVVYLPPGNAGLWTRRVIDADLSEGHAIACADLDGDGKDEIIAGWRGTRNSTGRAGIRIYRSTSASSDAWTPMPLDDGGMACEDLQVADLDGDGDLDVIAAGRATRNLKIYWNGRRTPGSR
ncbi:MAG TPA: FG-GAP repeat protein, partial [Planctomycetota bacterium]|nr:FG-GAP repeat protein [Planctomycetota bacterium]